MAFQTATATGMNDLMTKLSSFATWATSPSYAAVGSYAPPDPTVMRMKFAEMAQSLYWTTDAETPYTVTAGPDGLVYVESWPEPIEHVETWWHDHGWTRS